MGIFLTKRELAQTESAERLDFKSPVPTRMVSNGEFNPLPQTKRQRQFEERLKDLSEANARELGIGPSPISAHQLRYGSGLRRSK